MIAAVLLGGLAVLGVLSMLGWTVDTRDAIYSLWPLDGPNMGSSLVMVPRTEPPQSCSALPLIAAIARPARWPMTD